jgi:PAS domain S-box-containing protein
MGNSASNVSIIGIPVAQSSSTDKMRVGKPEHELENGALHLLAGGGDLGARMRQVDWSQTPLGPVEQWPQSLRTCVRILLTSRQPMFVWWGDDLINLYNDAYRSILGGKHPWALGKPASAVWREIWDQVSPRAETAMKTEEGTYDEALLLIMERNGYPEETYYTFSYSPVPNDQGGTGGIICANTDDTLRIIGERQISTLREVASTTSTSRTALEACELSALALRTNRRDMPFAMLYLVDNDRKTATLAATSGVSRNHQFVKETVSLTEDSDWPFHKAIEPDGFVIYELPHDADLPHGDWDRAPAHAAGVHIQGSGQTNLGGILVVGLNPFRIIDDNYRGFLSLLAGQISSAISNAQAYEVERQRAAALAELDRAKTAFFSNISHELRTPLTLMLGPIEDALSDSLTADVNRDRLELLHRNSLRLLKLVNALLDFSRIEAGRVQANFEPLEISSFTSELASVFRSAVERAGLRLSMHSDPISQLVFVDREMWEKIVLNLLSNALKSTFHGGIEVNIRDLGAGLELSIRDSGTGIAQSEIPHLFERFRRVEGARRRTHEGSGIGLALVKELVEMHGGTISVESELHHGTEFRVRIPYGSAHLPAERVRLARGSQSGLNVASAYVQEALTWLPGGDGTEIDNDLGLGSHRSLSDPGTEPHGRVLLVDDNRDMRDYVQRLLSRMFIVETATNGREALERALANPPDLVLSDVMMPEMDGFELLSQLRGHEQTQLVPVVLLSARAGEESRIEGLEAGADDYLVKPFTARELMARVDSHIRIAKFRSDALEQQNALREELRESQRRAAESIEQISDGFWMYDSELRITYMNAAAEKISERPRSEQIGHNIFDLFPDLKETEFEQNLRKALSQQVPVEFENLYIPWQRWFSHRVFPSPGGLVAYVRDTTEAKKSEQALRRAEQLAATGRLAASISHELNNPLEAVTNLLYLAKVDPDMSGNAKQLLEIADKELQRLSHIASKSLKFYRQSTLPSEVSLSELLDSVLFFYETRVRAQGITIVKRYEQTPLVHCYSGEIQQVFTNLISNALDALGSGGRLILSVKPADSFSVRVTIADTGQGMSKSTQKQIFQPFFTTKQDTGTGLGLWVTSNILEKHSASLRVRSRTGQGSVFSLTIPTNAVIAQAS